jgi:hypothetical protein
MRLAKYPSNGISVHANLQTRIPALLRDLQGTKCGELLGAPLMHQIVALAEPIENWTSPVRVRSLPNHNPDTNEGSVEIDGNIDRKGVYPGFHFAIVSANRGREPDSPVRAYALRVTLLDE